MKKVCTIDICSDKYMIKETKTKKGLSRITIYEASVEEEVAPPTPKQEEPKETLTPQQHAIYTLVNEYLARQKENYPKRVRVTPAVIETCYREVAKTIRLDGYKLRDLRRVLLWNASDINLFWSKNLLTLTTMRKKCTNENTKIQNIFDNYAQVERKTPKKHNEKKLDLPKWQRKVADACPCHGEKHDKLLLTQALYKTFDSLPTRGKRVFSRVGGRTDFVMKFWSSLGRTGRYPHCKTLMDMGNPFWEQYLAKLEQELGVTFKKKD